MSRQLRVNWLDRLILRDRDPYRPAVLLRVVRLQYAFALALVIGIAFTGFLWFGQQQRTRDACIQRNQSAAVSRQILEQLAAASRADRDPNAAMVWTQWAKVNRAAPLPQC